MPQRAICAWLQCFLIIKSVAVRVDGEDGNELNDTSVAHGSLYLAGDVFMERFQLEHMLSSTRSGVPLPHFMIDKYKKSDENLPMQIGAGTFGEVWKAWDKERKDYVAIKMFVHQNTHLTKYRAKLAGVALGAAVRECQLAEEMQLEAKSDPKGASRLMTCLEDHVTGIPDDDNTLPLFTVMEFCGDLNLEQWIKQRVRKDLLTATEVGSIFTQVMEGLSYMTMPAHKKLYVHHDLKPANIGIRMIEISGRMEPLVKLVDFGTITVAPRKNILRKGFIVSTYVYAPFEFWRPQIDGGYSSPWSSYDTFAAATSLVEMLSTKSWTEILMHQCMYAHRKPKSFCEKNFASLLTSNALPREDQDMVQTDVVENSFNHNDIELAGDWGDGGDQLNAFTIKDVVPDISCKFEQLVGLQLLVADMSYNPSTQRYEGQVLCKAPGGCHVPSAQTKSTRGLISELLFGSNGHTGYFPLHGVVGELALWLEAGQVGTRIRFTPHPAADSEALWSDNHFSTKVKSVHFIWGLQSVKKLLKLVKVELAIFHGKKTYKEAFAMQDVDLDWLLLEVAPNQKALLDDIFSDLSADGDELRFWQAVLRALDKEPQRRPFPPDFVNTFRFPAVEWSNSGTPWDHKFRIKEPVEEQCIAKTAGTCHALGKECPLNADCDNSRYLGLGGVCICRHMYCAEDTVHGGACLPYVQPDKRTVFILRQGANAVGAESMTMLRPNVGDIEAAGDWEECAKLSLARFSYLFTYFDESFSFTNTEKAQVQGTGDVEKVKGKCVMWSLDQAKQYSAVHMDQWWWLGSPHLMSGVAEDHYTPPGSEAEAAFFKAHDRIIFTERRKDNVLLTQRTARGEVLS
mmetsp:Transcript_110501/g.219706  ORF Transcript_110501/g.219706 Transcript_110501/m.219706 type:complete len:854 (-) Transcript_110501:14-2575(-)